ncbi:M48 family metalloprotease [Streptomyces sp. NPDC050560]|uniref:M48 family metalloprotease n=1 Tax=Streptomyces sp. NPDC050560 TaxID=3365630 RepID=UPI0037B9A939
MPQPQEPTAPGQPPGYPSAPRPPSYPAPPSYPDRPAPVEPAAAAPAPAAATAPPAPPLPQAPPGAPVQRPLPPPVAHTPGSRPPGPPPRQAPEPGGAAAGRVHITRRQRRTDLAAVGNLLLHMPNFVCSLLVMEVVALPFGTAGQFLPLAWLLSGALVFNRRVERVFAHRVLKLRRPAPDERDRMAPVWREVTARAGADASRYELWVQESRELNALAAAGHVVAVTRFALEELPAEELAAVLAHELGHHVGGHAWSSLLGIWYALPGRIVFRVWLAWVRFWLRVSSCFGAVGVLAVYGGFALVAVVSVGTLYGLPLFFLVLPYLLAYVSRRAELRADRQAAALGFGAPLLTVLRRFHTAEEQERLIAARQAGGPVRRKRLAALLATHPEPYARMHRLIPLLEKGR